MKQWSMEILLTKQLFLFQVTSNIGGGLHLVFVVSFILKYLFHDSINMIEMFKMYRFIITHYCLIATYNFDKWYLCLNFISPGISWMKILIYLGK